MATMVPSSVKRLRLRSSSIIRGQVSAIDWSPFPQGSGPTRMASRMTILSSLSLASLRRILSKPTSWATLPEMTISRPELMGTWSAVTSEAYLSWTAATKERGASAGRLGLTNEAAV